LQKVTVPRVTGEPLDTAAVNVTTVPEVTDADDNVSVVVVGLAAHAAGAASAVISAAKNIHTRSLGLVEEHTARMGKSLLREESAIPDASHTRTLGRGENYLSTKVARGLLLKYCPSGRAALAEWTVPIFMANTWRVKC
jgi:hypothetical protein